MVEVNFRISIVTHNLNEVDKLQKRIQKFKRTATKSFAKTGDKVKRVTTNIKVLDTGIKSAGNRLGFMAFQFTFMAGIAVRALQSIQQQLQMTIEDGATAQDAIVKAFLAADLDLADKSKENADALILMNNAIRDLGSGKTIFGPKEVANVFETVGRALPTFETKMKTVNATVGVSQEVLKLMTVEQVNAGQAAKGFAKILANYGNEVEDITRLTDVLVNVNRQSQAELDEVINAFGFAAQQGQKMGISLEQLGATLGLVLDITPQAGRAFTQLLREFSQGDVVFNRALRNMGIAITDSEGNFRNFIDVITEVAAKTEEIRELGGDAAVIKFQEMFSLDNNAARAFLAVTNNAHKLESLIESAGKRGTSTALTDQIRQLSGLGNIKATKAAIDSLKLDLTIGLLPAITAVTDELTELVRDPEIQGFFNLLGKTLSQEVIPLMKQGVKILKVFTKLMKDNAGLAKVLTKGFLILTGVLISLFIVGTLGSLFAIMASGINKVIGVVPKLIGALVGLRFVTLSTGAASLLMVGGLAALAAIAGVLTGVTLAKLAEDIANFENRDELSTFATNAKKALTDLISAFTQLGIVGGILTMIFDQNISTIVGKFFGEVQEHIAAGIRDIETHLKIAHRELFIALTNTINIQLGTMAQRFVNGMAELGFISEQFFTKTLPNAILNSPLGEIGRLIAAKLWFGFLAFIDQVVNLIQPFIDDISGSIDGFFAEGEKIGEQIWNGIKSAFGNLLDLIGLGGLGEAAGNLLGQAGEFIFGGGLQEAFDNLIDSIIPVQEAFAEEMPEILNELNAQNEELVSNTEGLNELQVGSIDLLDVFNAEQNKLNTNTQKTFDSLTLELVRLAEHQESLLNLTAIDIILFNRLSSYIQSLVANQQAMNVLTSGFNTVNVGMANLKAEADSLAGLFASVTISSDGTVKSSRPQKQTGGIGDAKESGHNIQNFLGTIGFIGVNSILSFMLNQLESIKHGIVENEANLTPLAHGGIVNRPTNALIGESGPEAVVPLNGSSGSFGDTNLTINVNIEGSATQDTVDDIVRQVERVVTDKITNKKSIRVR